MKYLGVIFDLDGVICHTDKYHYKAWKKIADELGILFNESINHKLRGISRGDSFNIILENYPSNLTQKEKKYYIDKKNQYYRDYLKDLSPQDLEEDTITTLEKISNMGLKIAIGSSSKNAKFILEKLGLEETFDAISDGTNIIHSKPHPEVFLKASEYLGNLPPTKCLVVEDAVSGIEAAIAANMDSAAIGEITIEDTRATYHINKLSDLINIFG